MLTCSNHGCNRNLLEACEMIYQCVILVVKPEGPQSNRFARVGDLGLFCSKACLMEDLAQ